MDGVLANFDLATSAIVDKKSEDFSKSKLWKAIDKYNSNVQPFFENLPLIGDCHVLVNYLKNHFEDIQILTASGKTPPDVKEQKIKWAQKHFPDFNIIVVKKASEKSLYANNDSILIDDRKDNILSFKQAGGIGILHTSAEFTINEIKDLFENSNYEKI